MKCFCAIEATRDYVKKPGGNHGKVFYRCSKYPNGNCTFFQWAPHETAPQPIVSTTPTKPLVTDLSVNSEDFRLLSMRVAALEQMLYSIHTATSNQNK